MPAPNAPRLSIPPTVTTAPKYDVLFQLAAGGMGSVSVARRLGDGGFQRLVALKRLHPALQHEPAFVRTFLEEARFAAAIQHPNVVPVIDVGFDTSHFLAMEYVPSEPLSMFTKACFDSGISIPSAIAARFIADACAGLHAAHQLCDAQGRALQLVHRDVSPGNLLITEQGTCRVTDFGIAKAHDSENGTSAGTVKGKANYLSPEQVRCERADARSDVFSLGVVLFEITTMRRLFGGRTLHETLSAAERCRVPDPRGIVKDYPDALAEIVLKALQREPELRFESAHEMGLALERAMETLRGPKRSSEVAAFVRGRIGATLDARAKRITDAMRTPESNPAIDDTKPAPRTPVLPKRGASKSLSLVPPIATKVPANDDNEPKTEECAAPVMAVEAVRAAFAANPASAPSAKPARVEPPVLAAPVIPVTNAPEAAPTPARSAAFVEQLTSFGYTMENRVRQGHAGMNRKLATVAACGFAAWLLFLACFHVATSTAAGAGEHVASRPSVTADEIAPSSIATPPSEHVGVALNAQSVQRASNAIPAVESHPRGHARRRASHRAGHRARARHRASR